METTSETHPVHIVSEKDRKINFPMDYYADMRVLFKLALCRAHFIVFPDLRVCKSPAQFRVSEPP